MKFLRLFAASATALVMAASAHAATVTYTGSADGTDFAITISETAGGLEFNVTATANPNDADLYALGFYWDGSPSPATTWDPGDFTSISSNTGEVITNVCSTCTDAGNGANFNGTGEVFDYIVRMGSQGTQAGVYLTDFTFEVSTTLTLAEAIGDTFGIRGQSTGPNGDDSIKLVTFTLTEVPVPAAGFLLLGGLGALGLMRRRKKA